MAYKIYSKAGADHGAYEAASPVEALAIMHRDAGYDVEVIDGEIVFRDTETARLCGGLSDWSIE